MLGKISGSSVNSIAQAETTKTEKAPANLETMKEQVPSGATAVQHSQLAYARMKETSITGSMQRAILDSALVSSPVKSPETAPVGTTVPPGDVEPVKTLKLNDEGMEVRDLQEDLNIWRRKNNLPEIAATGVYSKETEDAVKQFQRSTSLRETGVADESTQYRLKAEQSYWYTRLDPEVKQSFSVAFSALQDSPKGRDNLIELVRRREFALLMGPEAQKSALNAFMQDPENPKTLEAIKTTSVDAAILEKDKNYQALPDEIKRETLNVMFFKSVKGDVTYGDSMNHIAELAVDPNFGKRSIGEQRKMLEMTAATKDQQTSYHLRRLLDSSSFKNLTPEMQSQVIDIAHNNILYANSTENWPEENDVKNLQKLIDGFAFNIATEEDRRSMLEDQRKKIYIGDNS